MTSCYFVSCFSLTENVAHRSFNDTGRANSQEPRSRSHDRCLGEIFDRRYSSQHHGSLPTTPSKVSRFHSSPLSMLASFRNRSRKKNDLSPDMTDGTNPARNQRSTCGFSRSHLAGEEWQEDKSPASLAADTEGHFRSVHAEEQRQSRSYSISTSSNISCRNYGGSFDSVLSLPESSGNITSNTSSLQRSPPMSPAFAKQHKKVSYTSTGSQASCYGDRQGDRVSAPAITVSLIERGHTTTSDHALHRVSSQNIPHGKIVVDDDDSLEFDMEQAGSDASSIVGIEC